MSGRGLASQAFGMLATLVLISLATFFMVDLMPGDPAQIIAGEYATPEAVEQVRGDLGLDRPVIDRYVTFISDAARGDFGESVQVRPGIGVWELIRDGLPTTLSLLLVTMGIAVPVGVATGYLAGSRPNSWADRMVSALASGAMAVPQFVLATLIVAIFAVRNHWLPAVGYTAFSTDPWQWLKHLLLPAISLGAISAAEIARQARGSIVDVCEQDYVRMAETKGIGRRQVMRRHVVRNAATPVVTVVGLQIARIVGGSVVVEQIFGLPGVGRLAFSAVQNRDTPVLQGLVLVTAVAVMVVNLLVDAVNRYFDPKVRLA